MSRKSFVFLPVLTVLWFYVTGFAHASEMADLTTRLKSQTCSIEQEPRDLVTLFSLHNRFRNSGARCAAVRKRRAPSLQWSCELALASRRHAEDMETNDFLSHRGSDNSTIGMRATRAAYKWRDVSENVAQGYQDPNLVFEAWVSSQAHCNNIMNDAYQEFGAAKVGSSWVVVLGRQKDF